jgi:hypothetical protein
MKSPDQQEMTTHDGQRPATTFRRLAASFREPEMRYAPFSWMFSWEPPSRMDGASLKALTAASIEQRANPGYLFMLPRDAERAKKEFLSDRHFQHLSEALELARSSGTALTFCDEWTWPVGDAAGRVLEQHPELRAQYLHYEIQPVEPGQSVPIDPSSFFTVAARVQDEGFYSGKARILSDSLKLIGTDGAGEWEVPSGTGHWLVFRFVKRTRHTPPTFGQSLVNPLDRRLPECFIEQALAPLEAKCGADFGGAIPGFFSDNEGDFGWKLAWSDDLESDYIEQKGRDIRLWMPLLLIKDVEGKWAKARWDWFDVVSRLYADNLFKKIDDWATDRGMFHTIHFWEENLILQAFCTGSLFRAMRPISMPGTDCLGLTGHWIRFFKEVQSISEFENRRFMSETAGAAGWSLSPVELKKIANSMTAWGVSHVIPAVLEVDRDMRKVFYPSDLRAQPYWPYLRHWNDFVRRTSFVNSHGHTVPEVLLYYPIDGVWAATGGDIFESNRFDMFTSRDYVHHCIDAEAQLDSKAVRRTDNAEYIDRLEAAYTGAMVDLSARHVEYLIADSDYLAEMTVTAEGRLLRGDFSFKTVILPPCLILPLAVAQKLLEFAERGGNVYLIGGPPSGSAEHGLDDPRMAEVFERLLALGNVRQVGDSLAQLCGTAPGLDRKIDFLNGTFEMLLQHRRIDGRDFYWVANNTGREQQSRIAFRGAAGGAVKWDCEQGEIHLLRTGDSGDSSVLDLGFGPYEGYWVVFDRQAVAQDAVPASGTARSELTVELDGQWSIYMDPDNQPPPYYPGYVPNVPAKLLRDRGGIEDIPRPWSAWSADRFGGYLTYEKTFELPADPKSATLSLGEVTHSAEVWLNGRWVGSRIWPPYRFDLTPFAVKGRNRLRVVVGNLLSCERTLKSNPGYEVPVGEELRDAGLIGPATVSFRSSDCPRASWSAAPQGAT